MARDWADTIKAVVSHALSQKGCRIDRGEHKLISGEIKPSTWHRLQAPREPGAWSRGCLALGGGALSDSDDMEELRLHPVYSFLSPQRSGLYSAEPRR